MKNTTKLIIAFAAVTLATPAFADAEKQREGFYIAPEIGKLTLKDYCKEARADGATSCSESEIGFGLSGGYQFNPMFAIEAGARFSSGYDAKFVNPEITFDTNVRSFSLGGRGSFPIGQYFAITGKAGFHFWNQKVSGGGATAKEDGTDPYYGLGIEIIPTDNISGRVEYTRYKGNSYDADVISGSVVFHF